VSELAGLVVHEKLGTMAEKTRRITELAGRLGQALALETQRTAGLERAAFLSKADLVTQMVREFPELQGVMGSIYAELDGEPRPVAEALREQYLPRGAALPASDLGAGLALLDKVDTLLTGIAAKLGVSGSEDPYGLRRAAQGLVAIVLGRGLRLDLRAFAEAALEGVYSSVEPNRRPAVLDGVMDLLRQRLRTALIELGISYDTVDAVLEAGADDLADAADRARALWAFRWHAEFLRLYTAFDRAARILPPGFDGRLRPEALEVPAERLLWDSVERVRPRVQAARGAGQYEEALAVLAMLADPVDRFFTDVLVMADDDAVRTNRLALLAGVVELLRPVADLSRVVVEKEGVSSAAN
jgi:glycyl-tRNA synthetase beta chain